jgi:hypothetical protein
MVLIDQFVYESCRKCRATLIIFNHDINAAAVDASGLIDLIGCQEHAVLG